MLYMFNSKIKQDKKENKNKLKRSIPKI